MNEIINNEIWVSLAPVADSIAKILLSRDGLLRTELPMMKFDLDDVTSETYRAVGKVVSSYKAGALSLKNYCWKYVPLIVLSHYRKEYTRIMREVPYKQIEFDCNGNVKCEERLQKDTDDSETICFKHHLSPGYEPIHYKNVTATVDTTDIIELTERIAAQNGLTGIVILLKDGKTEREIADILGISKSAVHKRIVKLQMLVKNAS